MCAHENQEEMNRYIELLILSYFKQYQEQYSFGDIAGKIGLSELQVSNYISNLIECGQLKYENDLLRITLSGRNMIAHSAMENYEFNADVESLFESERWPITKVYCPKQFSKKRWRGNK